MPKASDLVEGDVYYRITFPDVEQKFPLVESFVFLGTNLSDEDDETTWYFQFAEGYARHGSILASKGGDRRVRCLRAAELEEMLSVEELTKELQSAASRRKK